MMASIASVADKATLSHHSHERLSDEGLLVYPVLSRRSGGISIGVNLNPDKICNFDCVYCQVDRTTETNAPEPQIETILSQLEWYLTKIKDSNGLWEGHPVKDIAFSGDGEPTTYPYFPELLQKIIRLRNQLELDSINLVMITNASRFHNEQIFQALPQFYNEGGMIWAKLDAGDSNTYHQLMKTQVPFQRILDNLQKVGQQFPITLQSCFMQTHKNVFDLHELDPYIQTVGQLLKNNAQIISIQAYTIARRPSESFVQAWNDETMDKIGNYLNEKLNIEVNVYYGKFFD